MSQLMMMGAGSQGGAWAETGVDNLGTENLSVSSLTGEADSMTGLFFASVAFNNSPTATETLLAIGDIGTGYCRRISDGRIACSMKNTSAAADIVNTVSANFGAERVNILWSLDNATGGAGLLYTVGSTTGASTHTDSVVGNVNLDWTIASGSWRLFKRSVAVPEQPDIIVYRTALWIGITAPDVIGSSSVRDNFFNSSTLACVDPAISVAAYGTPIFDFYGAASVWNAGTNQGSGGNFTSSGSFT